MELKCPQCGKWMAVSQEELLTHDSQVVCPQCLAVCLYENGGLVVRNDSDAPYRHNATVESEKVETVETARFCHSCGKQLPPGISFCPYCGVDLSAPFETAAPTPEPKPAPKPAPKPVREQDKPAAPVSQPRQQSEASRQRSSSPVEDKLRTITHHYGGSMHHAHHQEDAMPGTAFKVFAYIAIIVLLALLAYIIIAGLSIEPAM